MTPLGVKQLPYCLEDSLTFFHGPIFLSSALFAFLGRIQARTSILVNVNSYFYNILYVFNFQGTLSKDEWEAVSKFITVYPSTNAILVHINYTV